MDELAPWQYWTAVISLGIANISLIWMLILRNRRKLKKEVPYRPVQVLPPMATKRK